MRIFTARNNSLVIWLYSPASLTRSVEPGSKGPVPVTRSVRGAPIWLREEAACVSLADCYFSGTQYSVWNMTGPVFVVLLSFE